MVPLKWESLEILSGALAGLGFMWGNTVVASHWAIASVGE